MIEYQDKQKLKTFRITSSTRFKRDDNGVKKTIWQLAAAGKFPHKLTVSTFSFGTVFFCSLTFYISLQEILKRSKNIPVVLILIETYSDILH